MKSSWRKVVVILTSLGRPGFISSSAASIALVNFGVSASGCLLTVKAIADLPSKLASPRFSAAPICTEATCSSRTGVPSRALITDFLSCSID